MISKNHKVFRMRWIYGFLVLIIFAFGSCRTTKPAPYLQGNLDSLPYTQYKLPEPVIQKADLISIIIYSDNPAATAIYNQASGGGSSEGGSSGSQGGSPPGYLVDLEGNIRVHAIGSIHVEGLTKKQLNDLIVQKLIALQSLSNPYCVVQFINFKITVLGEVNKQGVYTIASEKATLLEALGMAGGLTDYGLKESVLVIRENQGKREYAKVDLSKANVIASPYFFLQQSDVVIVDATPTKQTAQDEKNLRNLALILSIISTIALISNIILRFQ